MNYKDKLLNFINQNSFLKNVLTLSSGVLIAQIITFLATPILGRIYLPQDFGNYTLLVNIGNSVLALSCLGMMTVFLLPKEDEEAIALSKLVRLSIAIISALILFIIWIIRPWITIIDVKGTPYLVFISIIYLYIVTMSFSSISYSYVNRKKKYKVLFWNAIITAIANVSISLLLGIMGFGFIGYTFGSVLSFVVSIIYLNYHENIFVKVDTTKYGYKKLLRKYKRFPIYQMPSNLISTLIVQLNSQMVNRLFSLSILGIYSMSLRLISLPVGLVAGSVNRVYFQEASDRYNKGLDIGTFSFNIIKTNIKIVIIPIMIAIVFGEEIFTIFLGNKWRMVGTFTSILSVYYLFTFLSKCLSGALVIIGKNIYVFYLSLSFLILTILFWIVNIYVQLSLITFLIISSSLGILYIITVQMLFFKLTNFDVSKYVIFLLKYIMLPVTIAWIIRFLIFGFNKV